MTVAEVKNYGNVFRRIIKHLENQHRLVKEGIILRSVLIGFTAGITPGAIITIIGIIQKQDVIISIGFVAVSIGIFIGIWRGLRVGRNKYSKVQKEDRFI
jgi:protein-S-isoprenylcysteine O-methyltransferase Ste14